mmetsp:Transcript_24779/g.37560  ORF Transcript_24779/g.37560 Transcript_24779/m.37560 type:complete len:139 (-) Transcript_24779:132-548(-)|eukprot:scaffold2184_cov160-Skeletonema_dohrnii-CCMP3373.AAC.11
MNQSSQSSSSVPKDTTTTTKTISCQLVKTKFEPTLQQQQITNDAFSHYSNKFNLMKALLLKSDDVEVMHVSGNTLQEPAAKRRKGTNSQPIQNRGVRQTKLSFEVHPSLLLYDDLLRMYEQMDSANISDDEESVSCKT